MGKKIFDILPPKELEKKEAPPEKERRPRLKKPEIRISLPPFKKNLFFIPLVLILIGIFCYFTPPHLWGGAEIEIWPETEIRTFKTKITGDISREEMDLTNKIIPAKIFEAEKTLTEKFPSSGKKLLEKKAEGIIRVYNNYSTSPQVLVATTRFVSADGKLFRSLERVTIPGGKYEEGKFVPGYLDIKVRADQPGAEYNIGPSTFSIPGFAGTALYTKFYGKSFQSMKGGEVKEVLIVTQKDLDEAKEILTKKAKEEAELVLREKISPEFDLLKEAQETKILEITPLAQAGQALEKFNFQVKAKSKALVFKPGDIKDFLFNFISLQIGAQPEAGRVEGGWSPLGKKVLQESLKISYLPENINLELGRISLSLEAEAKIFSDIDRISLKKGLAGKSLFETKIFLENQPQIIRAEVKLWPFWLKRIPEDLRKIEIKLNLGVD